MKNNTLVLLDGNALMHRAYHGTKKGFNPSFEGMSVGMVYGFGSTLLSVLEFLDPESLVVTFDTKEKTFRHKIDENYKAHREKAPDDFYPQLPILEEMLEFGGFLTLKLPGFESDDLIGTLATKFRENFENIFIVSGDLDFTQLVDEKIKLVKLSGNIENSIQYGPAEVLARFGVSPAQMIDFKAICGDSSDNYKGIEGIGPKGAEKLLKEFQSISSILENIDTLDEKISRKIVPQKDYLLHCQKLAEIYCDCPIGLAEIPKLEISEDRLLEFLQKMNFYALENRFQRFFRGEKPPVKVAPKPNTDNQQMSLF